MSRTKNKFISILTGLMVLCFFQSAHADLGSAVKVKESLAIQSAMKTDSAGSYAHGEKKSEGSKAKAYKHPHKKPEGSGSKSYSHGKNQHKGKEGHGYSKHRGHKKQHYAKSGHKSHNRHASKCFFSHLLSFKDKLQLSDAQVESIQKMRFDYRKTSVLLTAEKEIAKMDFDRLVHGKTVDESAIRGAGDRIIAAKSKKIKAKVEAKIAVMKLLTDEQRAKVHKMHSSH
ncbi:MAG: Spy/CpxP family protein refolding chaperone [Rhodospirillales bacterium]|nr:Spy/CpxP family protein refolding chaperone [Rhodospirillales bacterium]